MAEFVDDRSESDSPRPAAGISRQNPFSKKRKLEDHKKKDRVPSDDDDDDFDERRPTKSRNPFGASYNKPKCAARNPTPPPTGFQKRKEDLTYAYGKKSLFIPSDVSKEDRRKKARKE